MNISGNSPILPRVPAAAPAARPASGPASEAARPDGATLWDMLTPEERAYFTQAAAGPLAYRAGGSGVTPPAPTGQRLDVRA
ncbi:MAG: hypothetical protein AB7I33_04935 [Gemmatimonadales bacterium]